MDTAQLAPAISQASVSDMILAKIESSRGALSSQFAETIPYIGYFVVDDLLPPELAMQIYEAFPSETDMVLRDTLRERKLVSAQMDRHSPVLEEAIYAFQDERIVRAIRDICRLVSAFPDSNLYAGGVSRMEQGHFLNPHTDNSHDKDRKRWRTLNLLYYVSPDWSPENGGALELWPDGPKKAGITIESKFNRLVVMATHNYAWHSVSPVLSKAPRCCVSNYYFSDEPFRPWERFSVTSFRGRPEQPGLDIMLRLDSFGRNMMRKIFPKGVREVRHIYKR